MNLLAGMRAGLRARRELRKREDHLAYLLRLKEEAGPNVYLISAAPDRVVREALALANSFSEHRRKLGVADLEARSQFLRAVESTSLGTGRRTHLVSRAKKLVAGFIGVSLFGALVASAGAELGVGDFELPRLGLPSVAVSPEPEDGQAADQASVEGIAPVIPDVSLVPAETFEAVDVVFDLLLGGDESGPIAEDLPQAVTRQPDGDEESPVLALVIRDAAPSLPAPAGESEPAELQGEEMTETPQPQQVTALWWFPGQGRSSGPSENSSASPLGPQVYSQSHAGEPPRSAAAHGAQGLPQAHPDSQGHPGLSDDVSLQQGPRLDSPQEDAGSQPPGRAIADRAGHDRGNGPEDEEAALTA